MMRYKITYEIDTTMNLPTISKFLYSHGMDKTAKIVCVEYIGESHE